MKDLISQVAHPKLSRPSMLVQEEHMAQFVLHLAGTEFGAQHWDRTVLASAYHVLSDRCRGGNGGERAIKVSLSPLSSQLRMGRGVWMASREETADVMFLCSKRQTD